MKKPFLSVILPSFNEEENIKGGSLEKVYEYLKKQRYSWEVLVVDDASTDRSVILANKFASNHPGFKVFKEPHRGKGGTIISGMKKAKGKIILFTDMDQATPIDQLNKLLLKFKKGNEIVIGSRTGRKGAPLSRQFMAYGFVLLRKLILGLPYKDTQCGFKAFKRDAAESIFKQMRVFGSMKENLNASVTAGFDLEALFLAQQLGYRVAEVSVQWNYKDTKRVSAIHDSIEGLRDMMKIKFNSLLGKYN